MNTFTIIFLIALIISSSIQFWLGLNARLIMSQLIALAVPDAFKSKVPLEAHQKAADYTLAKIKLGQYIDGALGIIVLLLLTLGGGINTALNIGTPLSHHPYIGWRSGNSHYFSDNDTVEIPTSVYQTFVIEEKFGFNKSSVNQFIKDQLLHLGLGAAIGCFIGLDSLGYGQRWFGYGGYGLGIIMASRC